MSGKRQQQKQETARRIFEAAIELFQLHGYEATTVEMITAAAGVAKGTFFTHFPSKEAVVAHIGRLQLDRLYAAVAAQPAFRALSLREQYRLIIRSLAMGIEGQPAAARELTVATLRHSLLDTAGTGIDELDAFMAELAEAGKARGEVSPTASSRTIAVLARSTYFLALFSWLKEGGAMVPLALHYLDTVFDGITPRP